MQSCKIKKHKFILIDKNLNIRYEIYTNRELSKKDMMKEIRNNFYCRGCELPESDSKIMIVCED